MRVVFFSKGGPDVPSSRYRCFRVAGELARQGVEVEICDPPPRHFGLRIPEGGLSELWRLHRRLAAVRREDVLYLQRPTHNTLFVGLAVLHTRLRRLRTVFDYCDPLWIYSPFKTWLLTRAARAVVVSCEDLAGYARRHNATVHVLPNSVLPDEIAESPVTGTAASPVVGWIGAARLHEANLELLLEPFAEVASRHPFTFRIVGARGAAGLVERFAALPGLEVDAVDWLEAAEAAAVVRTFDLAVLPLQDVEWNRKLVTKLIEYLAAGVPVLASPVGDNRVLITDGENGCLARTPEEWAAQLTELLADPDRRTSLAQRGLETVADRCRLDTNVRRLVAILDRVA